MQSCMRSHWDCYCVPLCESASHCRMISLYIDVLDESRHKEVDTDINDEEQFLANLVKELLPLIRESWVETVSGMQYVAIIIGQSPTPSLLLLFPHDSLL